MKEFKVGDKVQVASGSYSVTNPGSYGTIITVYDNKKARINFEYIRSNNDEIDRVWIIDFDDLIPIAKPIEPKAKIEDKGWGL